MFYVHLRKIVCVFTLFCCLMSSGFSAFAQNIVKTDKDATVAQAQPAAQPVVQPDSQPATQPAEDPEASKKKVVRYSILFGEIPLIFAFGVKAWNWGGDHSFYSKNEGWFGANTDYGGQDKAGHLFAHYIVQRSMYSVFNWTENGNSIKWIYSLGSSMMCGLLIELGDGYSSKYGFSWQDLTVDYTGILFGAVLDRFPVMDGFFGLSGGWTPSEAYRDRFSKKKWFTDSLEFVNDYSAWKFMLNIKLAGFQRIGFKPPLVLRILQFDVGYYTRGYSNYDAGKYARSHTRNVFFGISVNSAQVFAESFDQYSDTMSYTVAHKFLEYYHIPLDRSHSFEL